MARFVLWGIYCADALEKRTPFREEHLAGLGLLKEAGSLITLGPTADTTRVFGIYEAGSKEEAEALVKGDVYWREGIWTEVEVHPWIQAF
ncbi:MAG: YciI family protein [Prochlorococcaceae cyanobacterium]